MFVLELRYYILSFDIFKLFLQPLGDKLIENINNTWRTVLLVEENCRKSETHNDLSSTLRLSGVRTLNISGDSHWLHG
jgi:hypothetical protein